MSDKAMCNHDGANRISRGDVLMFCDACERENGVKQEAAMSEQTFDSVLEDVTLYPSDRGRLRLAHERALAAARAETWGEVIPDEIDVLLPDHREHAQSEGCINCRLRPAIARALLLAEVSGIRFGLDHWRVRDQGLATTKMRDLRSQAAALGKEDR